MQTRAKHILASLVGLILLLSCQKEKPPLPYTRKICYYQSEDPLLRIYNDVLIEVVETQSYQLFLGKSLDLDSLMSASTLYELTDSTEVYDELNRLYLVYSQHQKAVYDNPTLRCTVYLNNRLLDFLFVLKEYRSLLNEELEETLQIDSIALDNYVPDSGKLLAQKLNYKKFKSCTFKIAPIQETLSSKDDCHIGEIKFSTVVLNKTQSKGWLYYEFVCGGTCGFGAFLTIEQVQGRWVIKHSQRTWVS